MARQFSPTTFPRFMLRVHSQQLPCILPFGIVRQVKPDSGFWKGASYHFTFTIPALYPHDPPKVSRLAASSNQLRGDFGCHQFLELSRSAEYFGDVRFPRMKAFYMLCYGLQVSVADSFTPISPALRGMAGTMRDQNLPPQHQPAGERVPQHIARRLEAGEVVWTCA